VCNDLDKVIKHKRVDLDADSYQQFFDHDWSRELYELTDGTDINDEAKDLAIAFKSCANTHILPWLMFSTLNGYAEGYRKNNPYGLNWLKLAETTIIKKVELSNMKQLQVRKALHELASDAESAMEQAKEMTVPFDVKDHWNTVCNNDEFVLALVGSQRLCYGGLYYAYEDFVLRLYRKRSKDFGYRIEKNFSSLFRKCFDESIRDICWNNDEIRVAREVRHALVHNGGRVTQTLKPMKHGIVIQDNELQIMPRYTKNLYNLLKDKALALVKFWLKPIEDHSSEESQIGQTAQE